MAWLHGVLAGVCLVVGGFHLVRVARSAPGRTVETGHAVMGLGMAGMYSPLGDPVPTPAWAAVFLLAAGWSGGAMLRVRSVTLSGGEAMHLLVGSLAMLFMLGADHQAGRGAGGHAAHAADAPGMAGAASAVALVFAAYFVLHALRCADRLRSGPHSGTPGWAVALGGPGAARAGPAVASGVPAPSAGPCSATTPALAHLLMTGAMAIMLVGMI